MKKKNMKHLSRLVVSPYGIRQNYLIWLRLLYGVREMRLLCGVREIYGPFATVGCVSFMGAVKFALFGCVSFMAFVKFMEHSPLEKKDVKHLPHLFASPLWDPSKLPHLIASPLWCL